LKTKIFIFAFLIFNTAYFCQGQLQSLISTGSNQLWNMDFASAEKTFNKIIKTKPESPVGYYYNAKIHFWAYLGSHNEGEYKTFLKYADLAQQKIEQTLQKNPKDYFINYIAGNLYSFRAMLQGASNSSVDGFWSSKKAVNYFEQSLEHNPKFYDAYLGIGLFDYAMSFVPDFLKWAVNLTGLSSDKARGFSYIKLAYRKGTLDKTEASFHLSKIYTDYLAEYDSAFIYLHNLTSSYPNNILFTYQYAVSLIKDKQLDQAMEMLNRVIKTNNKNLPQVTALAYFRKGEIFFKKNQYKSAVVQYDKFMALTKDLDYTGWASLNSALCYKFMGKEEEFKKKLVLAKNGNQDVFEDSYAKSKSEKYLAKGISKSELKLVKIKNYLDDGKYKVAYDSLKNFMEKVDYTEGKAIAYTYFCEAAISLKRYTEAIYAADQVQLLNISSEKWTQALSAVLKAKAKYISGGKKAARELLSTAEGKNDYEFKDYIQSQIEWLKRHLK
jgi:tetratricopeptide (TPR) repeat protein